jgi:hypothetical protein
MKRLGKIMATMLVAWAVVSGVTTTASASTVAANAVQTAVTPHAVSTCNGNTVNWAATYPTYFDWLAGQNATYCIGFRGTWRVPYNQTQVFCAGNNYGHFWWYDLDTGEYGDAAFSSDRSYSMVDNRAFGASTQGDFVYVYQVRIDGWTGSAGC